MRLEDVRQVASAYDDMFFHGAMGKLGLTFSVVPNQRAAAMFHHTQHRYSEPPKYHIAMSAGMPEREWRQVLLHEMVHAALAAADDPDEWEHDEYHGPRFARECNRIGRLLGLPDVSVDDCWGWPLCLFSSVWIPVFDD